MFKLYFLDLKIYHQNKPFLFLEQLKITFQILIDLDNIIIAIEFNDNHNM